MMPNKTQVEVLGLMMDEEEVTIVQGGENAKVKLKDINDEDIKPGFVLSSRVDPVPVVRSFSAQLALVELLEHKSIFSAGYTAVLHIHSVAEECEIKKLTASIDKKTGKKSKKKPMFCKAGEVLVCDIVVEQPICVEPFENNPQLGRFTLRDEGKSIGIGKILELNVEVTKDA